MPACFLIRKNKKGYGFEWVGRWAGSGRSYGRGNLVRIYYKKKKSIFNKKRKKLTMVFDTQ